ncbi:MAG: S1 RNA-binding domain-containing protein [Anaerolineae bacterium]|nr:S1 RNA-binding domain-containing protein [Anaerolineae bacterium]
MEELNHTSSPSETAETPIQIPEEDQATEDVLAVEAAGEPEPETEPEPAVSKAEEAPEPASGAPAAGEPAPHDDTPEEAQALEPASWEDQLEESLSASEIKRGELREGIILYRRDNGFVVDIGAKRDGFVPLEDIKEIEGREYDVGDEVPVVVTRFRDSDGNVELSISQALLQEDWLIAEKLLESQEVYETTVNGSNRGGLTVDFGRLRGFVPMSQIIGFNRIRQPAERQRRLEAMVDEEIMLKVIEVNRRRRRLILSQRAAAKEWRRVRRKSLLEELEAGQVRRGRISQITDFGLFVNLGGMDGLVHISELSWGRIENPAEVYHPGQRVKVQVLSVDRDRQRIALSIKALTPDPWESVVVRYSVGSLVEGKVTQVVDFGVFIELEPGVEGLLHNSELRDTAQREELSSGDPILVKVIRVEPERRRIGLSVRQVRPEEWEEWALKKLEEEEQGAEAAEAEEVDDIDDVDDFDLDEDVDTEDQDVDTEDDVDAETENQDVETEDEVDVETEDEDDTGAVDAPETAETTAAEEGGEAPTGDDTVSED